MSRCLATSSLIVGLFLASAPAHALCIYDGKLYAKTTLSTEFRDSKLVVVGIATKQKNLPDLEDPEGFVGTVSQVKVLQAFKGRPLPFVPYYSPNTSARFPLDSGVPYLLFLDLITGTGWEREAPGTWVVNYSCGQSREWAKVSRKDRARLSAPVDRSR